jgi:predicted transcriptional regulator YheO
MANKTLNELYTNEEIEVVLHDLNQSADYFDYIRENNPVDPDMLRYIQMSITSILHRLDNGNSKNHK